MLGAYSLLVIAILHDLSPRDQAYDMIYQKTAYMIGLASQIGGMVANLSEKECNPMGSVDSNSCNTEEKSTPSSNTEQPLENDDVK